jgi:hypothetical protein
VTVDGGMVLTGPDVPGGSSSSSPPLQAAATASETVNNASKTNSFNPRTFLSTPLSPILSSPNTSRILCQLCPSVNLASASKSVTHAATRASNPAPRLTALELRL